MIPFMELKMQYAQIRPEIDAAIKGVFERGQFIFGEKVDEFELEFSKYQGSRHCISVGSGTEALHLALKAAGIGIGDEVIIPSHTFIATALAVSYCGAKPIFVDIDEKDYCISPDEIKKAITPKTKAIIPVHLYGQYADMDSINKIAAQKKIHVIEDAAQIHGAEYKGKKKTFGNMACFSFYPTKNLGAYGDGGAITTDDDKLAEKLTLLRNYGQKKKYEHIIQGYNSRLDEIQAAILIAKLKHLDEWVEKRRTIAAKYNKMLAGTDLILPKERKGNKHAYYIYAIMTEKREKLQQHLKENGVQTMIHYPIPTHKQQGYYEYNNQTLPVTERIAAQTLSIPMFPEMTNEEMETVAELIIKFK
jgi:dTDP-4-amino-4,6-dideoxygalactose transaminase